MSIVPVLDVVPAWYHLKSIKDLPSPESLIGRKCRVETSNMDAKSVLVSISGLECPESVNESSVIAIELESMNFEFAAQELQWCNSPKGHIMLTADELLITLYRPPST